MINEKINHDEHTEEEKAKRGIETTEEKEKRVAETKMTGKEIKAKLSVKKGETKMASKTAKKTAKPKVAKVAKAKKTTNGSARAPRVSLSEKELSEPRVEIRIRPAVLKMVERYSKKRGLESHNEGAEKMIITAYGRIAALDRYNEV